MHFKTLDGLNLHYTDTGNGTPLLCLAGLTRNLADFDDLIAARPDAGRYICLTSRGRSGSDFDPDWSHYSIPQEAMDALALIDHLGLEKVTIIGTSRGGLIALALAAFARDRLAGVLFNDIGPEIERSGTMRILDYLGRDPKWATLDEAAAGMAEISAASFPGVTASRWRKAVGRWWNQTPQGLRINYDPHLRDAFEAAVTLPPVDLWPLYDALADLPLAVVRGANSGLLMLKAVNEMERRHPGLIRAEVPHRGHVPFLDEPEALAAFDALLERVSS